MICISQVNSAFSMCLLASAEAIKQLVCANEQKGLSGTQNSISTTIHLQLIE